MIDQLRRIDRAWARGEGWLTVFVLILMVFVAGFQAFVRNLTRFDIQWANEMLIDMDWADSVLRKGTLWLAFLGASLATHNFKHIGIDILHRIAPPRAKYTMMAMSGIIAGLITLGLTYSFWEAVKLSLVERPIEYELLDDNGDSMHVCDATDAQIEALPDFERPTGFCLMRSTLGIFGVPAETAGAVFQLIVPLMFLAIAIRLIGQGIGCVLILMEGDEGIARAEHEQRLREAAQREQVTTLGPNDGGGAS